MAVWCPTLRVFLLVVSLGGEGGFITLNVLRVLRK